MAAKLSLLDMKPGPEDAGSDAAPAADPFDEFYTKFMSGNAAEAKDAFQGMMSTCEPTEPDGDEPKPSLLDGFKK